MSIEDSIRVIRDIREADEEQEERRKQWYEQRNWVVEVIESHTSAEAAANHIVARFVGPRP